jgi:hypothetical protein
MVNIDEIATACAGRMEAMVFGAADYAASPQSHTTSIGGADGRSVGLFQARPAPANRAGPRRGPPDAPRATSQDAGTPALRALPRYRADTARPKTAFAALRSRSGFFAAAGRKEGSGANSCYLVRTEPSHLSGRQDLNLRPPGPQPGALPDCATPRLLHPAERATGIEPALGAWKAPVQPQHFARKALGKATEAAAAAMVLHLLAPNPGTSGRRLAP